MTKLEGKLALKVLNRLAEEAAFASIGLRLGRPGAAHAAKDLDVDGTARRGGCQGRAVAPTA
jgi:hypothetical protein